jgi:hypothetical protein
MSSAADSTRPFVRGFAWSNVLHMSPHKCDARVDATCTQKKETTAKKLFVGSTSEAAPDAATPGAQPVSAAPEGEAALVAEGVGPSTEVEIPAVEPDWAETLSTEGPGMVMQKLCGFRLSHAEKTPDDPAERCVPNTPALSQNNVFGISVMCFVYQDCHGCEVADRPDDDTVESGAASGRCNHPAAP